MRKHIDFFAVLAIGLAMLGFAAARSWPFADALDAIRAGDAIHIESCPLSRQALSGLGRFLR